MHNTKHSILDNTYYHSHELTMSKALLELVAKLERANKLLHSALEMERKPKYLYRVTFRDGTNIYYISKVNKFDKVCEQLTELTDKPIAAINRIKETIASR